MEAIVIVGLTVALAVWVTLFFLKKAQYAGLLLENADLKRALGRDFGGQCPHCGLGVNVTAKGVVSKMSWDDMYTEDLWDAELQVVKRNTCTCGKKFVLIGNNCPDCGRVVRGLKS